MPPVRTSKRSRQGSAPAPAADDKPSPQRPSAAKRARRDPSAEPPPPPPQTAARRTSSRTTKTAAPNYGGHKLRNTAARKQTKATAKAAERKTTKAKGKAGASPAAAPAPVPLPYGLAQLHNADFKFQLPQPSKNQKFAMFAFGQGDDGQFGLGPVDDEGEEWSDELGAPTRSKPVDTLTADGAFGPAGLLDVYVSLSQSSFGIDANGQLWSWGYNDQGQLARRTDFPDDKPEEKEELVRGRRSRPGQVDSLTPPAFVATKVAAGDQINAAISSAGKVQIWGAYRGPEGKFPFSGITDTPVFQPMPVPLDIPAKIVDIAAGNDHFVARDDRGHVWTWGTGECDTLGRDVRPARGRRAGPALDAQSAENVSKVTPHAIGLKSIVSVAAGFKNCFAIDSHGKVFAWGANNYRQLALFDMDKSIISHPTEIEALRPDHFGGSKVVQIASGEHHTVFLFDDGTVRTAGRCDSDHQTGIATTHPLYIAAKEKVSKARQEILELKQKYKDEMLKKAQDEGLDTNQEMIRIEVDAEERAQEEVDEPSQSLDELVTLEFPEEEESKPTRIIQVITGPRHTLAVSSNGYVYAWGSGQTCQLGHGDMTDILETPSRIRRGKLAKEFRVFRAAAGGTHNLLLAELREDPVEAPKSNGHIVDATLQVKSVQPAPAEEVDTAAANGADTEMNGAHDSTSEEAALPAAASEDTQMNES